MKLVYRPRHGHVVSEYEFSPPALVSRQGVYLVGPLWTYDNVVQIALHLQDAVAAYAD